LRFCLDRSVGLLGRIAVLGPQSSDGFADAAHRLGQQRRHLGDGPVRRAGHHL
jgi:hypothetical protein